MSQNHTTSRLITAYGERELWKEEHDWAMLSYTIEDSVAWGINLFLGLNRIAVRHQARWAGRWTDEAQAAQDELQANYAKWLVASQGFLVVVDKLCRQGYEIDRVEEFRQFVAEAECMVENAEFEKGLPSIEELCKLASPENPDPDRYRE